MKSATLEMLHNNDHLDFDYNFDRNKEIKKKIQRLELIMCDTCEVSK